MYINPQKSGIMRILWRRGKFKVIENALNIPEVESYRYLGITITQSLRLDEHENKLRNIEKFLSKGIGLLKPTMIMTKSRIMIFKSILRSKVSYALATIWTHNEKYTEKWESMLYRLLKRLFYIRTNVAKQKMFKVLGIKNGD